MDISSRIAARAKELGLKQVDIVRMTGATKGTVSNWFKGSSSPKAEYIGPLARALQKSESWVLTGKESNSLMLEAPKRTSGSDGISESYDPPQIKNYTGLDLWDDYTPLSSDEVALPFFREVHLSAGHGSSMVQENGGAKLRFAKSTLRKCGVNESTAACVTVSGNSMEPVLPDGATVGIDTEKTAIKDGKMFAIDHGGMLRVKILYRLPNGGIRLRSFNRDEWPDEDISGKEIDQVRIIGQVFWSSVLY
jgi:phage repressor protein C with HTH and peptisase S24 domain